MRGLARRIPVVPPAPPVSDGLADLLGFDRQPRPLPPAGPLRPERQTRAPDGDPAIDSQRTEPSAVKTAADEDRISGGVRDDSSAAVVDAEMGEERTIDHRATVERVQSLADRHRALIRLQWDFLDEFDRVEAGEITRAEATRRLLDRIDALLPSDNERGASVPSNLRQRQTLQRLATDILDARDRSDAEAIFFDSFVNSPEAEAIGEALLGLLPGVGEAISARDAYQGFLAALQAAEDGRTRDALIDAGLAGVSTVEAIPILGKAVKLTRGGAKVGVAVAQLGVSGSAQISGRIARDVAKTRNVGRPSLDTKARSKSNRAPRLSDRPDGPISNRDLDAQVQRAARQLLFNDIATRQAVDANKAFPSTYDPLPYKPGTTVKVVQTKRKSFGAFVRLHRMNKKGAWIMRKEDVLDSDGKLLSPMELQRRFALPKRPTHISSVEIPEGVKIQIGVVNPPSKLGGGSVVQYEIVQDPQIEWFKATEASTGRP